MKGVILAAGEGTRIRSVTYGAFPKELLPIGNVPTIRFPIEALKLAGVRLTYVYDRRGFGGTGGNYSLALSSNLLRVSRKVSHADFIRT